MSIVEPAPGGLDPAGNTLQYRLDQQSVLADFGREALKSRDLDALLRHAVDLSARGLNARFAKILKHIPERNSLLLAYGIGWEPGLVGTKEVPVVSHSGPGWTFLTGESVICNSQGEGTRFCTPEFMIAHGINRAINVAIDIDGRRFGVLEVDAREDDRFVEPDLAFLSAFANLLGLALGRIEAEQALEQANNHQRLLTREVSHRVKNSLSMVVSLLGLRARGIADPTMAAILADMQARIHTIARAHDLLWRGDQVGTVPVDAMICELADELVQQSPGHRLECRIAPLELDADVAIPLGLMVTELVTNALKYAYDGKDGEIFVEIDKLDGRLSLVVRDGGRGLPPSTRFDGKGGATLGARIIASTARQLRGTLTILPVAVGTAIRFEMPIPSA